MGIEGYFSEEQSLGRLRRDYIPALRERFEARKDPLDVERTLSVPEAEKFAQSLISSEVQKLIADFTADLAEGNYRTREVAGEPGDGTRHVHDFVIEKSAADTQLFYVDPEHSMGKNKNSNILGIPRIGDLRPRVNVLYAVRVLPGDLIPEIELLRYRAAAIPPESPELNKPGAQLEMAELLLESGELPSVVKKQEKQITFRLSLRKNNEREYKSLIQARETSGTEHIKNIIEHLIKGEAVSSRDPIEGQLRRFKAIMRTHFPRLLKENRFVSLEN